MLSDMEVFASQPNWVQIISGIGILFATAAFLYIATYIVLIKGFGRLSETHSLGWMRVFFQKPVLRDLVKIVPLICIHIGVSAIPKMPQSGEVVIRNLAMAMIVLYFVRLVMGILDAFHLVYRESKQQDSSPIRSIKSYVQLMKLLAMVVGGILIVATLIDRSPLILLSGLGAMSAVLMIVFRDTLLSFTAGVQIASNDILRIGDWIEFPQMGADGDVIDIALHTVKVQNWDKTITSIPTWKFMSESFKNWRGMKEYGGRRIKRTFLIDTSTVRFLTAGDIEELKKIHLISDYLEGKVKEINESNSQSHEEVSIAANSAVNIRKLTNIGTLRAYLLEYLKHHPGINKEMLMMVRMMQPTSDGVPMELYCFTTSTAWEDYEGVQGDIFDHLLSTMQTFDLALFQSPTGRDFQKAIGAKN